MGKLPIQTPSEEFTERFGETASGLLVIPHLIALENFRRAQQSAQDRVDESNRMMMKSAGFADCLTEKNGDDDEVGGIYYTGDISVTPGSELQIGEMKIRADRAEPAEQSEAPPKKHVEPAIQQTTKRRRRIWPWVLSSLIAAGGLGAGALSLYQAIYDGKVVVHPGQPQDWGIGIEVKKEP